MAPSHECENIEHIAMLTLKRASSRLCLEGVPPRGFA